MPVTLSTHLHHYYVTGKLTISLMTVNVMGCATSIHAGRKYWISEIRMFFSHPKVHRYPEVHALTTTGPRFRTPSLGNHSELHTTSRPWAMSFSKSLDSRVQTTEATDWTPFKAEGSFVAVNPRNACWCEEAAWQQEAPGPGPRLPWFDALPISCLFPRQGLFQLERWRKSLQITWFKPTLTHRNCASHKLPLRKTQEQSIPETLSLIF